MVTILAELTDGRFSLDQAGHIALWFGYGLIIVAGVGALLYAAELALGRFVDRWDGHCDD